MLHLTREQDRFYLLGDGQREIRDNPERPVSEYTLEKNIQSTEAIGRPL
jgi:hypothetical protein